MEKFTKLEGIAAPMLQGNVNTDAIFPSRFMTDAGVDLAKVLFANWRYDGEVERPDFVLNQTPYRDASVLLGGENFGCGSSREQAVWALAAFGIRCIIAPSFADIFLSNCFQNGILCIAMDSHAIWDRLERQNSPTLTVDLTTCNVSSPAMPTVTFAITADRREALLTGMDEMSFILSCVEDISAFEVRDQTIRPWVYPAR